MLEDKRGPPTWRLYTTVGSVILCGTFRRISQLWDDAHTLNLENCLLYLLTTTSQFFDFVRCIVFDFIFYCVTAHILFILVMVKPIQYLMYPCNCYNFVNKNLYCCNCFWVLQFCFNPSTLAPAVTSLGLPLLMSSLLTKIGIIYTQLLHMRWKRSFQ